jgi:hypothetical protein
MRRIHDVRRKLDPHYVYARLLRIPQQHRLLRPMTIRNIPPLDLRRRDPNKGRLLLRNPQRNRHTEHSQRKPRKEIEDRAHACSTSGESKPKPIHQSYRSTAVRRTSRRGAESC